MPNFERHAANHYGGVRAIATLTADSKHPILYLGSELIGQGFNINKWYVFLWDEKTLELGLQPVGAGEKGFVVKSSPDPRGNHTGNSLRAKGFCKKFGIKDRMTAAYATHSDGTWILKMTKVK